jgi:hypothetical protein
VAGRTAIYRDDAACFGQKDRAAARRASGQQKRSSGGLNISDQPRDLTQDFGAKIIERRCDCPILLHR